MHITDFHPDPYYKPKATLESGCHRLKGEKAPGEGKSGKGKSKSRFDSVWHAMSDDDDDDGDDDVVAGKWGAPITLVSSFPSFTSDGSCDLTLCRIIRAHATLVTVTRQSHLSTLCLTGSRRNGSTRSTSSCGLETAPGEFRLLIRSPFLACPFVDTPPGMTLTVSFLVPARRSLISTR